MVIGLYGGSFNPPHEGHALVAKLALQRLGLNQLWWMVTPGNPLKSKRLLAPLSTRLAQCEAIAKDPRIKVTAFEQRLGTSYTAKTLKQVMLRNPQARFIWLMGADNLETFHHWQNWRQIVEMMPIAVIDRPGATLSYLSAKMARAYQSARIDEQDARLLWKAKAPAWTFLHGPRSPLSSTALRREMKLEAVKPEG